MNVFTFILALVAILLGFSILRTKLQIDRKEGLHQEDEAALIQTLNRDLVRMEQRIETLETLLLERETVQQRGEISREPRPGD